MEAGLTMQHLQLFGFWLLMKRSCWLIDVPIVIFLEVQMGVSIWQR